MIQNLQAITFMATLYGISNCDTVKKARKWLDRQQIEYLFHDFRKQGLERSQLEAWADELGWEALVNRRGTTWRRLPEGVRETIDHDKAIELMLQQPAIIKRPLLDLGTSRKLGFKEIDYQSYFEA